MRRPTINCSDLILLTALTPILSGCIPISQLGAPTAPSSDVVKARATTLLTLGNTAIPSLNRALSPSEYARAGYTQVREQCDKFFSTLTLRTNSNQLTKADWTALGAAAGAIIALAHPGAAKPVGIAAAAFGLGSSAYDNYQKYGLITLYPEQTKILVFKALDAYQSASPAGSASDMIDADARVSAFAEICTYSNINALAINAIATTSATVSNATPTTVFTSQADLDKVAEIAQIIGISNVSDTDLATLEILAKKSAGDPDITATLSTIADSLTDSVKTAVWDGAALKAATFTTVVVNDLAALMSNSQFAKMVNDSIAKSKAASAAAAEQAQGEHTLVSPSQIAVFVAPAAAPQDWRPPTILLNAANSRTR